MIALLKTACRVGVVPLCCVTWISLATTLPAQDSSTRAATAPEAAAAAAVRLKEPKGAKNKNPSWLQNGTVLPEDKKLFEDYYQFRIHELTYAENPDNRPKLSKKRDEIKGFLRQSYEAAVPDVHDEVNDMLLKALPLIAANEQFDLVVRLNAMYMLGDLNQVEPDRYPRPQARVPVPLPVALDPLLAGATDDSQPDIVRIAALVGLQRHAASDVVPDGRGRIVQAWLKVMRMKPAPGSYNADAIVWMQRLACEGLAAAATRWAEARTNEVSKAISRLMLDESYDLATRCYAACGLGSMDVRTFDPTEVPELLSGMGKLVVSVARVNTQPPAAAQRPAAVKPADPEAARPEGENAAPAPPAKDAKAARAAKAPPKLDAVPPLVRKLRGQALNSWLTCVELGLRGTGANRGLRGAAEESAQPVVDRMIARIGEVRKLVLDTKADEEKVRKDLLAMSDEFETWMSKQKVLTATAKPGAATGTPVRGASADAGIVSQD